METSGSARWTEHAMRRDDRPGADRRPVSLDVLTCDTQRVWLRGSRGDEVGPLHIASYECSALGRAYHPS